MAFPSPKRKVEVPLVPCCPPRHVSPHCHPAARAQSSFSMREAAFWDVQKSTLYRALHDGRPVNSWCWRVLANSATV